MKYRLFLIANHINSYGEVVSNAKFIYVFTLLYYLERIVKFCLDKFSQVKLFVIDGLLRYGKSHPYPFGISFPIFWKKLYKFRQVNKQNVFQLRKV